MKFSMAIGMMWVAASLLAADEQEAGNRGFERGGGRMNGRMGMMRRGGAINLERYGWIDEAQAASLAKLLATEIQRHNSQLLTSYDKNHNGKIDAEEAAEITQANRSRRLPPSRGRRHGGSGGDDENGRPPAPPEGGNGGGMGPPPEGMGPDAESGN